MPIEGVMSQNSTTDERQGLPRRAEQPRTSQFKRCFVRQRSIVNW
jgi:hypothetical protein